MVYMALREAENPNIHQEYWSTVQQGTRFTAFTAHYL